MSNTYVFSTYKEYQICLKRGHQKSNRTMMIDGENWDICRHCGCGFRYVSILKETKIPNDKE
jgi:hypothetical protein